MPNFEITPKQGYYYNQASPFIGYKYESSGATYEGHSLGFNKKEATVKVYLFTFENGANVDFTRVVLFDNLNNACDTLTLRYTHGGQDYEFNYTNWNRHVYVPKATNISVEPHLKNDYKLRLWMTADAYGDGANKVLTLKDGNPKNRTPENLKEEGQTMNLPFIGEVETPVRAGSYTGSTNMAFYVDSGYKDLVIFMHMNKDGSGGEPQKYTHKLIYDANGGNGGPQDESSKETTNTSYTFTVSDTKPTRENYTFLCWADNADATGEKYNAGDKIPVSGTKTIYAVWKSSINPPTYDELKGLVGKVAVNCITGTEHGKIEYDLIEGSYIPGVIGTDGDGNYTYSITINPESYVATYEETNAGHTLDPDTQADGKPVTFVWDTEVEDENKWVLADRSTVPVVFTVKHATTFPGSVSAVTKTRLTDVTNVPLPSDVDINDINTEGTVQFTDNNTSATLLYEFKVTGTPNTVVTIADSGAKFFKPDNTTEGDSIEVTIGENGAATVYGYKTFTKVNITDDGKLKNTATATNKNNPDNKATGSSDVPAEDKTTEITGEVKNVEKKRILEEPQNVTLPNDVTINKEETVTFTDNNTSATLLYAFTVTGTPGAKVVIKDTGATFIKNTTPISTEPQQITVTLPVAVGNETETSTTVYGYRIFNVGDIQNGYLVNTATANVPNGGPEKDKTDTEDVPALDNRTLYNTLTVKKLVSGNAASTTEEFPFKATFTFPVLVASPTQDNVTYDEDKTVVIDFELAHERTKTFSYTSDQGLRTKIDEWMKENTAYRSLNGDDVFAMLRYKVEETDTKGYTLATNGYAEGTAIGDKTVTFTNTKNKPNDDHGGHYHPTTTPVPVIVIPPKTGDMPFWYSIAQFLGLVK